MTPAAEHAIAVIEHARLLKLIHERDEKKKEGMTGSIEPAIPSKTHPKKAIPGGPKRGGSKPETASLTHIAETRNESRATVHRTKKRGEVIGADNLNAIAGTSRRLQHPH